jgi:peptide/nickel transport system permease protein
MRAGGRRGILATRGNGAAVTPSVGAPAAPPESLAPAVPGSEHFVSTAPFDPTSAVRLSPEQERFYLASQWTLMWWKFKRHRVAVVSAIILLAMYASTLVTEVLVPYNLHTRHTDFIYAPPQRVHVFHEGRLIGPFVYGLVKTLNMETLRRDYTEDTSRPYPLRFFCSGDPYRFWNLVEGSLHVACPSEGATLFLLGTDRLGRDVLSRIFHGARISLTIGLIGIAISFALGLIIGGIAGYFGGWVDLVIQRIIEVIRSFPELPLWMALSAVLPVTWSPILIYFGITGILAMLEWTGLARAVRSKLLALREEDYCTAARLMGAKPKRIIGRHLLPGFMSHLIASATLSIPGMILGETALSFLGIGLRPPITSWGVLLNEAQNINVVALYPWLMLPVVPVIIVILAFNFFGDGLRDAADPYR